MTCSLALLAAFTLSSCDKDAHKAWKIAGEWEGDMGMYYEVENRQTGDLERFNASRTIIKFDQEDRYSGWGEEVDYYDEGPAGWTYYSFDWPIHNGDIRMTYHGAHNLDVVIRDYKLKNSEFYGYIGNTEFHLKNVTHYNYDWDFYDPYWLGFTYWTDPDYYFYYSKSRDLEGGNAKPETPVVRHGSRYMEGFQETEDNKQ